MYCEQNIYYLNFTLVCKKGKITAHGHHPEGDVGLKKLNFLSLLQTLVTHDFIAPSSSVYFPGEIKEHRISQGCLVPVYELTQTVVHPTKLGHLYCTLITL